MTGKAALITGGSRGIGRAIALKLADEGAHIAILYAGNREAAEDTVCTVKSRGVSAVAVQCDVADYAQVEAAVREIKEALGAPDILINNAGVNCDKLALRMTAEDFDRVVKVNLNGAFHTIRAIMPDLIRKRAGRIINITSVSGMMGNAGQANYAASKAGMIGLTKTIARELAGRGITCNAVAPGFIKTDMTQAMNGELLERALKNVPLKRIGEADDVAEAVCFLASEKAAYITGEVLKVDGGLYM